MGWCVCECVFPEGSGVLVEVSDGESNTRGEGLQLWLGDSSVLRIKMLSTSAWALSYDEHVKTHTHTHAHT